MVPFLELQDIVKRYGNTLANNHVSLHIDRGDVLALVGANGAGKSTLMRVISGVTRPDTGTMTLCGNNIDLRTFSPTKASQAGIHVAYQELSLCGNLTVYENFYVELSPLFKGCLRWRKKAASLAEKALNDVFPGNGIDVHTEVAQLSIAQQQMVEISRAFADPNLQLLILDEPTSSLPIEQTNQLLTYIRKRAADGVTFIYITHRLFEIIQVTNRVYILKNGQIVDSCDTAQTSEDALIEIMGSSPMDADVDVSAPTAAQEFKKNEDVFVSCKGNICSGLHDIDCELYGGEIIGISGLEGNGQRELIRSIFYASPKNRYIRKQGSIAYVTGDRKTEGNFPLWSIADNIAITSLVRKPLFAANSPHKIVKQSEQWYNMLRVKGESPSSSIMSLSGGNQQKVLIARALQSNADIIILDDPTRGVDVETKMQLYSVFREAAAAGKLVIWYSSDDSELDSCSRVLVMRYGTIVKTLFSGEISKDSIIEASFTAKEEKKQQLVVKKKRHLPAFVLPMAVMLAMYLFCGILRKSTLSLFGAELLLSSALPLVLASLSQAFIIGLSDVNLSIGNFMGFVCVMTATSLFESPLLGVIILLLGWIAYGAVGVLIRKLNLTAVIVTLGFSFIWYGIALLKLQTPGGVCPEILSKIFNGKILGLSNVFFILILSVIAATLLYRSKYGTVLRGFGNREDAMVRSGWNRYKASFSVYFIGGFFALLGGIAFTSLTGTADAGSMDSYTMLTVAAVVLGGGEFTGGRVNHLGAACGAVTLSLVTILLGFLHVSSDYTAAVNGLMLIIILSFRLLRKGGKA